MKSKISTLPFPAPFVLGRGVNGGVGWGRRKELNSIFLVCYVTDKAIDIIPWRSL